MTSTGLRPSKMKKPMVLVAVENCWDLTTDLEPLPPPPPTLEEMEGGGRNISHSIVIFRRNFWVSDARKTGFHLAGSH